MIHPRRRCSRNSRPCRSAYARLSRDELLDHRRVGDELLDHRRVGDELLDHRRVGDELLDHRGVGDELLDHLLEAFDY